MELFTYTFIQYAFLGGISIAILAGLFGPFVVHSHQSYASDMFSHVALGGVGLALVIGIGPWWGALPALLLVGTLLWYLDNKQTYTSGSLAILFLSGGIALALACVHIAQNQVFSFENYLFGSILTLTPIDIIAMAITTLIISLLLYLLWYPLIGATQTPIYTIPFNSRPQLLRLLFFWILAIVVWIGVKTIGGLLIGALLVIPTLIVRSYARSFGRLVCYSLITTTGAMLTGLVLSIFLDLPPSSLIIGTLISLFTIQLGSSYVRGTA